MKIAKLPEIFQKALPIIEKIEASGYEAYFVGGSVRDVLLNHAIHDVDIATSAFPAEIKELFSRTIDVGIEHGTVMVLHQDETYEITTFRTESEYQDYRRPDKVSFVRSLAEDLKRRDFTINALALTKEGTIVDLYDGLGDLQHQVLRAVGKPQERFHEDALRMMRGLRFVSQLGFQLEEQTFASIQANHHLLEKISVERITVEFVKLLMGPYRRKGIEMLIASRCFEYCPSLDDQEDGLLKFMELPDLQLMSEVQSWALLIYCLEISKQEIRPFLKSWKVSNELIRNVQLVVQGLRQRQQSPLTSMQLYEYGEQVAVWIEELLPYFNQEMCVEEVRTKYHELPIHSLHDLQINGRDLMTAFDRKPGAWLKELLSKCETMVVSGVISNDKISLLEFSQKFTSTK